MDSYRLYLILGFLGNFLFSLAVTTNMLYQVEMVGLGPLQLVLVGTCMEMTAFLFEVPTGVVADLKSRRLSVIIGYAIIGIGFILEGSIQTFVTVAVAQGLMGFGHTFVSGAKEAWIADEVGEARTGQAYIRGSQAGILGGLLGVPFSVLLAYDDLSRPIVWAGIGFLGMVGLMIPAMRETGFTPAPREAGGTWKAMKTTVRGASELARRSSLLRVLLLVSLVFGLSSEGFDRLWTAHMVRDMTLPYYDTVEPVVWFGAIAMLSRLLSLGLTEWVRRKVDVRDPVAIGRMLTGLNVVGAGSVAGFALSGRFDVALACYFGYAAIRSAGGPLRGTWYNQLVTDSRVRATMFSVQSQLDAVGQIAGGPPVGFVGRWVSLRAAILTTAGILFWVVPLFGYATRLAGKRSSGREASTSISG